MTLPIDANTIFAIDPTHVVPTVFHSAASIAGQLHGPAVLAEVVFKKPGIEETFDSTHLLRHDFMGDVGDAIVSLLANGVAPPLTIEPNAGAPSDHVRVVLESATVSARAKLRMRIQSRPAHVDRNVYDFDVPSGYALACGKCFAELRRF